MYFHEMRTLLLALLLGGLASGAVAQSVPSADSARAQLDRAERAWLDTHAENDRAALKRLLADGFTITYPGGKFMTRDQVIDAIKPEAHRAALPRPRDGKAQQRAHERAQFLPVPLPSDSLRPGAPDARTARPQPDAGRTQNAPRDGKARQKSAGRARFLPAAPVPSPDPVHYTVDRSIRLIGRTAILTGVYVNPADGERAEQRARYTDTWMWIDGHWQVVASHLSSIRRQDR
jgi:hypothetical protein